VLWRTFALSTAISYPLGVISVSRGLLKTGLRRTLVPWLDRQAEAARRRPAGRQTTWQNGRYPDHLATSLARADNSRLMRIAVKRIRPDAEMLQRVTAAVLPGTYATEVDYLADLVILAYGVTSAERDAARVRMLRTVLPSGVSMLGDARVS